MRLLRKIAFVLLIFLSVLLHSEYSDAQNGIVVYEGQQKNLGVIGIPGEIYSWKIYNKPTFLVSDLAPPADVEYSQTTNQSILPVIWKKQGDYFFTVTAFNLNGCKNMKVGYVKVISPPIDAVAGNDTIIGTCNTVVLDGSKSFGDGLKFFWQVIDPGGTVLPRDQAKTTFSLSTVNAALRPSQIRVLLTVTSQSGQKDSDTLLVIINNPPLAKIIHPNNPNKDGSMVIDGSVSKGNSIHFQWNSKGGTVVSDPTKQTVLIRGEGIYMLEVTDQFGCKSATSIKYPFEVHSIVATPDYYRTSWIDSVRVRVLNNDYDSNNDIDKGSVTILRKPMMGGLVVNKDGTIIYTPDTRSASSDYFVYQICDSVEFCDTAQVNIDIFEGPVWIPEGISANGDSHNEYFVIRGLEDYPQSSLVIYSRAGQMVYRSLDYQNDWSGRSLNSSLGDNVLLPTGTYYYVLQLGGTKRAIKGFVYLMY